MSVRPALTERTEGRWAAILPLLGIERQFLTGKNGPCPMCGGKDRWRWINREGSGDWWCNACGHGDGIELAKRFLKLEFKEAAKRIEALIESAPKAAKPDFSEKKQHAAMKALWEGARPVTPHSPAGFYLLNRGLMLTDYPKCLRYHHSALYERDTRSPALLAKVINAKGDKAVNIHRTFITPAGYKADLDPPRKVMFGSIPPSSAVRLFPAGPVLGVAEGIETALAANQMFGIPIWALLGTTGMQKFVPPEGTEELVIFGDSDLSYAGHAAAYALAHRTSLDSPAMKVRVEMAPQSGKDWNDELCSTWNAS